GNCSAATTENRDVIRALTAQLFDHICKELDVSPVIARNADGPDILLDRGSHDIADRAMITQVDHFDSVPDKFEVDRVDRTVVPVANRDRCENSDRDRHGAEILP